MKKKTESHVIKLLIAGIGGVVLGLLLLILAKYMLTNYPYTVAQTNRSHDVNRIGLVVQVVGLALIVVYIFKTVTGKPKKHS